MADSDAATETVPLREFDHIVDVQMLGSRTDIKMHIDIDIEFSSKLENTQDLRSGVSIVPWSGADYICASPQTLDDQLFRSRQIRQPVLGKHANLNVGRPSVGSCEPLDRVEAAHTDDRIDFDMRPDVRGASHQTLLQRPFRPAINLFRRQLRLD